MKIRTFEAARGLLALWVVIGHTIKHAGYDPEKIGPWKIFATPELAVDCFIMLSGFVIFLLLDTQRVSYREYISRRFMRIAPMYFVVLAVSALTLGWQLDVILSQRWSGTTVAYDVILHHDALNHLTGHLVAHATMLHGLVPSSLLPNSVFAIVGQAWSISVEWQFYLIAPGVFYLVMTKRWRLLGALLLLLPLLCKVHIPDFAGQGSVTRQAGFFVIGILSYYLWKHSDAIQSHRFGMLELSVAIAIVLAYFTSETKISLIIWAVMLGTAIVEKRQVPGSLLSLSAAAASKPYLQWLGKSSYSLYMVHNLVIYFWLACLDAFLPTVTKAAFFGILLPLVLVTAIAVSALTYRWIELPFMQLGRRGGSRAKPLAEMPESSQHPA